MQHLEVSGAVRHIYVVRQLRVKCGCWKCHLQDHFGTWK